MAAVTSQAYIQVGDTFMGISRITRLRAVVTGLFAFAALGAGTASAQVVISQIYPGGALGGDGVAAGIGEADPVRCGGWHELAQ